VKQGGFELVLTTSRRFGPRSPLSHGWSAADRRGPWTPERPLGVWSWPGSIAGTGSASWIACKLGDRRPLADVRFRNRMLGVLKVAVASGPERLGANP